MRIKICGITCLEDAQDAVQLGADALGFIFYEPSPRYVSSEIVSSIVAQLPPFVSLVGVFVDSPVDEVVATMRACQLHYCQLHGQESVSVCDQIPYPVIKAISVANESDIKGALEYEHVVSSFLFDTKVSGQVGGTGQVFDWSLLEAYDSRVPMILSGGLNASNVATSIQVVQPSGIDLSSGVELRPGKKSKSKMKEVMDIVQTK